MVSLSGTSNLLLLILLPISIVAAQDLPCGTRGYHDQVNLSYFMGNFFYNGPPTLTLCASYCKQDDACEAFRYSYYSDADSQYCEFFASAVGSNFTLDNRSPYYYYDIACSFAPFEDPVTSTSLSTLTSISTLTSLLTLTSLSTLTSFSTFTSFSTLLSTVTSISTGTVTSIGTITSTLSALGTTTITYTLPALRTTTITRASLSVTTATRTITAQARTITFTATRTTTALQSTFHAQTENLSPQTTTVRYPVPTTFTAYAVRTITRTIAAVPPPPQTVTIYSTRTVSVPGYNGPVSSPASTGPELNIQDIPDVQDTRTVTRTVTVGPWGW